MAVATYHDAYGTLPPAYVSDAQGKPMHSWRVLLLPFLEQQELYEQYDFDEPWDGPNNRKLLAQRPSVYAFHGSQSEKGTAANYLAVVGAETAWPHDKPLRMDQISDGAELTILIVENEGANVPWTAPRDLDLATMNLEIGHPRGISSRFDPPAVVTADGSVHTLSLGLSRETLRALLTARSGEKPPVDANLQQVPDGRGRPMKSP